MTSLASLTTHLANTFDPAAVREYAFDKYLEALEQPHSKGCAAIRDGDEACHCSQRVVLEASLRRYREAWGG